MRSIQVNSSLRILLNEDIHHLSWIAWSLAGGVPTNWFGPLPLGVMTTKRQKSKGQRAFS